MCVCVKNSRGPRGSPVPTDGVYWDEVYYSGYIYPVRGIRVYLR